MSAAPLRGTQSLVGQMGWVLERPLLIAIEIGWRWLFGIPLLVVCWRQAQRVLIALPPEDAGLKDVDGQNPWVAAVQLAHAWSMYQPHVVAVLRWLLPAAGLVWIVISGLGRSLILNHLCSSFEKRLPFRPVAIMVLQAVWLAIFGGACWCWYRSVGWAASTHITVNSEPDLIGYAIWVILLSLGLFTAWALVSWAVTIAPLIVLLEKRSALSALGLSLRLGKAFTGKLIEINLVMGIVKLALIVLAMVFSAAPLPFSDQLGADAMHVVWACSAIFFLVASDYFQVVRLKGFFEFWRIYREPPAL